MREKCGSQFEKMETLAEYKGFKISISFNTWQQQYVAELKRENQPYRINLGTSTTGNITRIENAISGLPKELDKDFNWAGSPRRLTPAYPRFWVFSDCTFLDNSRKIKPAYSLIHCLKCRK